MNKKYICIILMNIIALQDTCIHTKNTILEPELCNDNQLHALQSYVQELVKEDIAQLQPNPQQEFITKNGTIGIYYPDLGKVYIGDEVYGKLKFVPKIDSNKKIKKQRNVSYLGDIIQGDKKFGLYGRNDDPVPVNHAPDSDVRTQNKIDEDFLSDFGSGKYTPNDKWD